MDRHPEVIPAVILFVLNLVDVATTYVILGSGGTELNPISASLVGSGAFAAVKVALSAYIVWFAFTNTIERPRPLAVVLWIAALAYLVVVVHNLSQIVGSL